MSMKDMTFTIKLLCNSNVFNIHTYDKLILFRKFGVSNKTFHSSQYLGLYSTKSPPKNASNFAIFWHQMHSVTNPN